MKLVFLLTAILWLASATDERQPPPCWKNRVWGLRDDVERDYRCSTAFIHTAHRMMNRIPTSSASRVAEQHKNSEIDIKDSDGNNEQDSSSSSSFRQRSKDEWIDGRTMMQLIEMEKAREEQERQRQRDIELFNNRLFQTSLMSSSSSSQGNDRERVQDKSTFVSRISYTDANTLQLELPPSGIDSNVFFSGAFSALWFSAVGPATIGMLSTGGIAPALFMVPFWLAGGMVAKMAVVDPFVSSKLSIGDYLWTLEKNYFRRIGNLTSKKQDGPTEAFKGASVEVGMVVNNVPRYELRLFFDGSTISFGNGLSFDELEYLAETINEHCTKIAETRKLQQ